MKRLMNDVIDCFPGVMFKMQYSDTGVAIDYLSDKSGPFYGITDQATRIADSILKRNIASDDFEIFHKAHLLPREIGESLEMILRCEIGGETRWFLEKSRVISRDTLAGSYHFEGIMLDMTEKIKLQKAIQAVEAKDNFLAAMSHELRTPLNAISGFLYLLTKTEMDTRQQEYLATIQTASNTLLETINEVLDFSKIEAGKLQIVNKPFNLDSLLRDIHTMFTQQAKQNRLEFKLSVADDVPRHLYGDMFHIRQILINLIGNAFKFTFTGGIVVKCMLESKAGQDFLIKFTVTDTGIGMDRNVLDKVFIPFTQADGVVSRRHKGTGLGLSIVKSLAEMLGGTVSVASKKGEGSTFSFSCKVSQWGKHVSQTVSLVPEIPKFSRSEVLLVEDNVVNRQIAAHLLQDAGLCVVEAENGLEALKLVNGNDPSRFSLILMDIEMPVLDGLRATHKIRSLPNMSSIPIIAMTAHAFDMELDKCIRAGMTNHICKPLNIQNFYGVLSQYLSVTDKKNSLPRPVEAQPDTANSGYSVRIN